MFSDEDDVNVWANTCIALHNEKAKDYALHQVRRYEEAGNTSGRDFWLNVSHVVEQVISCRGKTAIN